MPRPNVIITRLQSVDDGKAVSHVGSAARLVPQIVLPGDKVIFFDVGLEPGERDAYLEILKTLQEIDWPAYIALNEAKDTIRDVRIPEIGRVRSLTRTPNHIEVALDESDGVFTIDDTEDPQNFRFLEGHSGNPKRQIAIVAKCSGEIEDAQDVPADSEIETPPSRELKKKEIGTAAKNSTSCLKSEDAVRRIFNELLARSCDLPSPAAGCIPFRSPYRGCEARAHTMCQILANRKVAVKAAKIWHFGRVNFKTPNSCKCSVDWNSHTAAFVRVSVKGTSPQIRVLDPSMFCTPVTEKQWRDAMGTKKAAFYSMAHIYKLDENGIDGRNEGTCSGKGCEADRELKKRAVLLKQTAKGKVKPPPYDHCL
jgi:hypothetical protein